MRAYVVRVDVFSQLNRLCGKTDHLTVAMYRLPNVNVAQGDLVPGRDAMTCLEWGRAFVRVSYELDTALQVGSCYRHIILWV
jgi:hypothetical protein